MGTKVGAVVEISQGLGSPLARLVGSLKVGAEVGSLFCSGLAHLRSLSEQDAGQRAPAGRPRLCLCLCQKRPWQAGQEGWVGPRGLEARQGWQLPSLHFFRFAQRGDPGVRASCRLQTKSLPRRLCSPPPGEARRARGSCCRTGPTDGKGWAPVNRTLK